MSYKKIILTLTLLSIHTYSFSQEKIFVGKPVKKNFIGKIIRQKDKYAYTDSVLVYVKNISNDSMLLAIGLEYKEKNRWQQIDNDIFQDRPKVYFFFHFGPKEERYIKVPMSNIDTAFFNYDYDKKYKFFITQYYVDRTYFFPLEFHMLGSFRLKRIYELRKAFEELRPHNKPKKN